MSKIVDFYRDIASLEAVILLVIPDLAV